MKKSNVAALLLAGVMVLGMTACGAEQEEKKDTESVSTEAPDSTTQTPDGSTDNKPSDSTEDNTDEEDIVYEGDAATRYVELYKTVLDQHYQAVSEKWNEEKLLSEDLSPLLAYCYEGKPLENIAYAFADINGDGFCELFIEPVSGDEFVDQMIFAMYTLKNGKPKLVFCGDERNRYYLSDTEEGAYFISNYASSGALQSTWNYYILEGDSLSFMQGIVYDAGEDESHPWAVADDENGSVKKQTDEKSAQDIIDSYETRRIQPDYISFMTYR